MLALTNACFYCRIYAGGRTGVRLSETALGWRRYGHFSQRRSPVNLPAMIARRRKRRVIRRNSGKGIFGGIGTMGILYGLALWAMTCAPLAVVAALRETSILAPAR
ncbi:hypothetical protein KCP78_19145 [Salmonella enterica subsp. enterica]|nr:hypothetical protein KCP78_19145 [Salmonella enterica subsp. enterica]